MTSQRISPSGPLVNDIFGARGSLSAAGETAPGEHFITFSGIQPAPNPVVTSPTIGTSALVLPKGKYLLNIFGRFGNAGSTQTVWSAELDGDSLWSWAAAPGATDWISREAYFDAPADSVLRLNYTNLADSDPSLFDGKFLLVRIG